MFTNDKQQPELSKSVLQSRNVQIIVEHTFGNLNLTELYADYTINKLFRQTTCDEDNIMQSNEE